MSQKNNPPPNPQKPQGQGQQRRMTLELPRTLEAVYSNAALIAFTPAEVVIDFVQMLPRSPKAQIKSRVIMSPMHAKLLQRALAQHVANFERTHGEIKVPKQPNLADEFFKFPRPGEEDDEKDKE